MSTWLLSQAVGHLVSAPELHCRELGVSQPLPPSLKPVLGPLVWREVGTAGGNFAQSLRSFFSLACVYNAFCR